MNPALQPFITVALPIMVTLVATIWIAQWSQNKRFEDLKEDMNRRFGDMNRRFGDMHKDFNRRLDEVIARLERIERKLDDHEQRIVRLEERTSPLLR